MAHCMQACKHDLSSEPTGQLTPQYGHVELSVAFAMLDQHVGLLGPALTLRKNFLTVNPAVTTHTAHAALARFGF